VVCGLRADIASGPAAAALGTRSRGRLFIVDLLVYVLRPSVVVIWPPQSGHWSVGHTHAHQDAGSGGHGGGVVAVAVVVVVVTQPLGLLTFDVRRPTLTRGLGGESGVFLLLWETADAGRFDLEATLYLHDFEAAEGVSLAAPRPIDCDEGLRFGSVLAASGCADCCLDSGLAPWSQLRGFRLFGV